MLEIALSVEEGGRRKPEYTLQTDLRGEISLLDFLEFTKRTLIVTADEVLRDEIAQGFDKTPVVVIDNSKNKTLKQVNPLGQIEFVARANMNDIIIETYDGILHRSKVLTGAYIQSHYVFLNGIQVANNRESLVAWLATNPTFKESDKVRFVNIQPYARKLERLGVTAQRSQQRSTLARDKHRKQQGIHVRVPNGTYFLTARSIKSKFKRNADIRFTFISGAQLGISGSFKITRSGKPGRPYLYPSIILGVQELGIV